MVKYLNTCVTFFATSNAHVKNIFLHLVQDEHIYEFEAYGMTGQFVQEAPIGKN